MTGFIDETDYREALEATIARWRPVVEAARTRHYTRIQAANTGGWDELADELWDGDQTLDEAMVELIDAEKLPYTTPAIVRRYPLGEDGER